MPPKKAKTEAPNGISATKNRNPNRSTRSRTSTRKPRPVVNPRLGAALASEAHAASSAPAAASQQPRQQQNQQTRHVAAAAAGHVTGTGGGGGGGGGAMVAGTPSSASHSAGGGPLIRSDARSVHRHSPPTKSGGSKLKDMIEKFPAEYDVARVYPSFPL